MSRMSVPAESVLSRRVGRYSNLSANRPISYNTYRPWLGVCFAATAACFFWFSVLVLSCF